MLERGSKGLGNWFSARRLPGLGQRSRDIAEWS